MVATQVVEAGIDLNAAVLVTEAAPWPSLVQRAGRCNRTGRVEDAELWWLPPAKPLPYEQADIDASSAELSGLEGRAVTGEDLLNRRVDVTETQVAVLRRSDLIGLFDTAPDLSGADIDIAPYVRDAEDLDVQLAWATWKPEAEDDPAAVDGKAPPAQWRCRVPVGRVNALIRDVPVWRLDQVGGRWTRVYPPGCRARPGEGPAGSSRLTASTTLSLGFDPGGARSWCPDARKPVSAADPATGAEDTYQADSASKEQQRGWISLEQHSRETRDQAACAGQSVLQPTPPRGRGERPL